jgi:hypothetical protein
MHAEDFFELSVEQEEYLVELLCTRGAYTLDWFVHDLDRLLRAVEPHSSTSPSSVADCASSSSLSLK